MKPVVDLSSFEFHYGEASELSSEEFAQIFATPKMLSYPRPILLGIRIHGATAKKQYKAKLIETVVRQFGTVAYTFKGNLLLAYTPSGSAKAENIAKAKRLVMEYGDLDEKNTFSVDVVLAYPSPDNAEGILAKVEKASQNAEGVLVYDDVDLDPSNPLYLSGDELKEATLDFAKSLGFTSFGLGLIIPERNRVEIIDEQGKKSFSLLGGSFALERLLPFVAISRGDPYFYISDSRNLPPKPMAILDSLGAVSAALRFFSEKGKLIGFAYATSPRNLGYFGNEEANVMENLFAMANKRFLLLRGETLLARAQEEIAMLSTDADQALVRIDQKGYIVSMSPNLAKAYAHEARINDKASKPWPLIFGAKKAAPESEVALSELGSGAYRFHYLGQDQDGVDSYLFSRLEETTGSKRKEKATLTFTREAFDSFLQDDLLAFEKGTLLFLRLANAEALASKVKSAKVEQAENAFGQYLVSQGYGYSLYHYEGNVYAYFLPRKEKEEGKQLAISLANKLSKVNKLGAFGGKLEVDYLLLTYPIEVHSLVDVESFVRALFGKSDDFGHGRLMELNKERGRLLLASAYEEEAVKKAMVAQEVPFRLTPIKDISANKIAYLHLDLDVRGDDGDEILPPKILAAAKRVNLLPKMMGLAQEKLALSYLDDSKTMKAMGYRGVMFHVPMELLLQDNYYNAFLKALPRNRNFLMLRFGVSELERDEEIGRLNDLRKAGFLLALEDYKHQVDYDFDAYITMLGDLTSGASDKGASFLSLCQKHARANKVVAVGFVDDPAGIAFLNASHLHYAMGLAAGKALGEKELMTSIRNKRKGK
ncbi:MAG: EAL domain-containing protein [Bacilli bacterium]|nr:EAL domain-containing protein [Bacilli bacterium]